MSSSSLWPGLCPVWKARDDLDLEIETRKPVHTDRCPVGIGRSAEDIVLDDHAGLELVLGVSVKRRYIDDIGEGAAGCLQRGRQVAECQPNLAPEIRFGGSVGTAADLS